MTMVRSEKAPPAMPFFGKDAYTDESFLLLDWDAQGLFWRLAYWQWDEGDIPADIERVIAIVGKPRQTRKLWPAIVRLFGASDQEGRLRHAKLHDLREKAFEDRRRRQFGAGLTNAKLGRSSTLSDTDSDTLSDTHSDTDSGTPRVATATAKEKSLPLTLEGVQGKPSPPPDAAVVERVERWLDEVDLNPPPARCVTHEWLTAYGETLITETLTDVGHDCRGKSWKYLAAILKRRKENPNEQPANRKPRTDRRPTPAKAGGDPLAGRPKFTTLTFAELQRRAEAKLHSVQDAPKP